MYLSCKTPLPRLRAYRRELGQLYVGAVRRRDLRRARELFELRRRVHRSILLREEWLDELLDTAA